MCCLKSPTLKTKKTVKLDPSIYEKEKNAMSSRLVSTLRIGCFTRCSIHRSNIKDTDMKFTIPPLAFISDKGW
ncbi:MAG: hypothetical protein HQK98_06700 [Nitrospirae bacterium]|nr:hypothetical protein [Nitrospirota bacterium]